MRLDDAVAVVADHMGAAEKGLAAIKIEWDDGPHAKLTTADVARELEQATLGSGAVAQNFGDADKALASAATRIEASYQVPFLAHATMEPMNCTVHLRPDTCEIWIGSQAVARVQAMAAKAAGLPPEKVIVHNHLIGGGFGRRLEADGAVRAVEIARHVDGPVKVVWTREEDIQHDMYRPYWFDRLSAGLDAQGRPAAWKNRFAGSSVIARWLPPGFKDGLDPTRLRARSTFPTTFPTFTWNLCAWSRAFQPRSGAASVRRTIFSSPKASSTSWQRPRNRMRWPIAGRSSTSRRAPKRSSILPHKKPAGDRPCPREAEAGWRCSSSSAAISRRLPRWKYRRKAPFAFAAWSARSIAAPSSIQTR